MKRWLAAWFLVLVAGCERDAAQPARSEYAWPERISWRMDYVSETQRQTVPLAHYAETKTLRVVARGGEYVVLYDSVLRSSQDRDGVRLVPLSPEDTLAMTTTLGTRGEIGTLQVGCDRALPECAAARTSALLLDLRRVIPRLAQAWQNAGASWEDTIEYSEATLPGSRSSVVTAYTRLGDTTVSGTSYAMMSWRALHRTFHGGPSGTVIADQPVVEQGVSFIDRARGLPVYSTWAGAVPAPPSLRAAGATGTGFRGRSYLSGTVFDSLYSRQVAP